ncbi:MAG: PKD domain-containing protein [Bacteroidota bacterium]|nr:PKD domain-containing protein [Bacteroidota bacterium]MDP4233366.1 PKD domain-containing protein [Bacteroidota bacterium]MDP4242232.1 PKD domain-containing protein [Bacteroidota bacterium]MDP4286988.1 PKD domain-containing protein [Bacteroidota bacterium]
MKIIYRSIPLIPLLVFVSCLSTPNGPIPSGPTTSGPILTIQAPDTVRPGDPTSFKVTASDSIRSTWLYLWRFGDGDSAKSAANSLTHTYSNEGVYIVTVLLIDSATKYQLSSFSKKITVALGHVDLATLHSFKHVTISGVGMTNRTIQTAHRSEPGTVTTVSSRALDSISAGFQVVWNGASFSCRDTSYSYTPADPTHNNFWETEVVYREGLSGVLNQVGSAVLSLSAYRYYYYDHQIMGGKESFELQINSENYGLSSVNFFAQTGSNVTFIGIKPHPASSYFSVDSTNKSGVRVFVDENDVNKTIDWSDTSASPRVTITFSK